MENKKDNSNTLFLRIRAFGTISSNFTLKHIHGFNTQADENLNFCLDKLLSKSKRDFSGGPVVKNLPAKAGDECPIPSQGRPHMLGG